MPEKNGQHRRKAKVNASVEQGAAIVWWVKAVVVLGALLFATGAVLALVRPAMLASPHDEVNGAVRVYAGYLASRNTALAVMLVEAGPG